MDLNEQFGLNLSFENSSLTLFGYKNKDKD